MLGKGLIPEAYKPEDDHRLLSLGIGFSDIVKRCTASLSDLSRSEIKAGQLKTKQKHSHYSSSLKVESDLVHVIDSLIIT